MLDRRGEYPLDVLKDEETRTNIRYHSQKFTKHNPAGIADRSALSSRTEGLARRPPRDNACFAYSQTGRIENLGSGNKLQPLLNKRQIWAIPSDGFSSEAVAFDRSPQIKTGGLQAKIKTKPP